MDKRLISTVFRDPQRLMGAAAYRLRSRLRNEWSWRDVSLAAAEMERTDPQTALELHSLLERIDPAEPAIRFRHAAALLLQGRKEEALAKLEALMRAFPAEPSYQELALRAVFQGTEAATALDRIRTWPVETFSAPADAALAIHLLNARLIEEVEKRCLGAFGPLCTGIRVSDQSFGVYSAELLFADGGYSIEFSSDFLFWPFLVDRMISLAGYLTRYCAETRPAGRVRLSLGDAPEGDDLQLCFCGDRPDHLLIPDPIFLQNDGYAEFKSEIRRAARPFRERAGTAYWRGSLTGLADTFHDIMKLPRVTLSLMALHEPKLDAKITDLSQFGPLLPDLQFILEGLGVIGPKEDALENARYRYLVDVDGNTNSWPGLFMKLASGGVVVKLKSENRQWFYGDLKHQKNVLLIESLDELPFWLDWCEGNEKRAATIGANGSSLVRRMTAASEYRYFARSTDRALAAA